MCCFGLWPSGYRAVRLVAATVMAAAICGVAGVAAQQPGAPEPEEEYGEFLARPDELASTRLPDLSG
jgi:hypothetical protein